MSRKLDRVMDWQKPYTMIFSGVENEQYFNILYDMGVRDFLISYEYIKSKKDLSVYRDKGVKFFIDSGAFTYMQNPKYQKVSVDEWEQQIEEYLEWAEDNKDLIFAMANLDLEYLVGVEKVEEWNRKYFEPFMARTEIPVCFIWHIIGGDDQWEQYCERYPYVGMSWASEDGGALDLEVGLQKLRVAEKHNALVHGMGMTRTSELTKIPFYTSDSTTWLVGLQYGEVNYWRGNRMSRLKKEQWQGEYLQNLIDLGFDEHLLLEEDTEEMIKVNIKAFLQAIEYIDEAMSPLMYWRRRKPVENDLADIVYPSLSWLKGENGYEDYEEYAKQLNVSLAEEVFAINTIIDMSVITQIEVSPSGEYICHDPDLLDFFKSGYLESKKKNEKPLLQRLHDLFVNQITFEEKDIFLELKHFYQRAIEGKEEKILHWGTLFDRVAKEREIYLEDEEHDLVELTEDEMIEKLKTVDGRFALDSGEQLAPEIYDLDDEIFNEAGIVPQRDDKGRFLKGHVAVRKPKNIYSDKFPKMMCNTCYAAQTCPEYKAGMVCAFHKIFSKFDTRDSLDVMEAMQGLANLSLERVQKSALFENLYGGIPTSETTAMISQAMTTLNNLQSMYNHAPTEVLRRTTKRYTDGRIEEEVSYTGEQQESGGLLEKLLMRQVERNTNEGEPDGIIDEDED